MEYNPNSNESDRYAKIAAMVSAKGYNSTLRELNKQLKSNLDPNSKKNIESDKGYLKFKYSKVAAKAAIQEEKANQPPIPPPAIVQPALPSPAPEPASNNNNNNNNNKKMKKIGSKEQVFYGEAERTSGGLRKEDLILNPNTNKVISKKKSEYGKQVAAQRLKDYQLRKANAASGPEPAEEEPNEEDVAEIES